MTAIYVCLHEVILVHDYHSAGKREPGISAATRFINMINKFLSILHGSIFNITYYVLL